MSDRVLFLGSKGLGLSALRCLHRLAPERLAGAITINDGCDGRSELGAFRRWCADRRVPLEVVGDPPALDPVIRSYRPDLCVVVGWYWIIPPGLLDAVAGGWVGVHASMLPKYRGFAPLVWAIINGERESGVSLFRFSAAMDAGDIIGQERFAIGAEATIADVLALAERSTVRLLERWYPPLLAGSAPGLPQDERSATAFPRRRPGDGLIDWSRPAPDVLNFIRAQSAPYPGAFTHAGERTIVIERAALAPATAGGPPGTVIAQEGAGARIACGSGAVTVLRLRGAGGRDAPVDVLLPVGARLA